MKDDDLSIEKAKESFSKTIQTIRDLVKPFMETREGRNQIRATFGCRIEGFEEEDEAFFGS